MRTKSASFIAVALLVNVFFCVALRGEGNMPADLLAACKADDAVKVGRLLNEDLDPNLAFDNDSSCMYEAVNGGNVEMLWYLLRAGARIPPAMYKIAKAKKFRYLYTLLQDPNDQKLKVYQYNINYQNSILDPISEMYKSPEYLNIVNFSKKQVSCASLYNGVSINAFRDAAGSDINYGVCIRKIADYIVETNSLKLFIAYWDTRYFNDKQQVLLYRFYTRLDRKETYSPKNQDEYYNYYVMRAIGLELYSRQILKGVNHPERSKWETTLDSDGYLNNPDTDSILQRSKSASKLTEGNLELQRFPKLNNDARASLATHYNSCHNLKKIEHCAILGMMYSRNLGYYRDIYRVRLYTFRACENGVLLGCYYYAQHTPPLFRNNEQRRNEYIYTMYKLACDGGYQPGCAKLPFVQHLLLWNQTDAFDIAETSLIKTTIDSCQAGEAEGCLMAAKFYEGNSAFQNVEFSKRANPAFRKRACLLGSAYACIEESDEFHAIWTYEFHEQLLSQKTINAILKSAKNKYSNQDTGSAIFRHTDDIKIGKRNTVKLDEEFLEFELFEDRSFGKAAWLDIDTYAFLGIYYGGFFFQVQHPDLAIKVGKLLGFPSNRQVGGCSCPPTGSLPKHNDTRSARCANRSFPCGRLLIESAAITAASAAN